MFQNLVSKFSTDPKQLFLFDGAGALLSAFLLGVVLVQLESFFGIPKNTLYFLALLPCFFALYDFYCFAKVKNNLGFFLKGIAYINLTYCIISMGLAFYHHQQITHLGWFYIIIEIIIVVIIAIIELQVAKKITKEQA